MQTVALPRCKCCRALPTSHTDSVEVDSISTDGPLRARVPDPLHVGDLRFPCGREVPLSARHAEALAAAIPELRRLHSLHDLEIGPRLWKK